MPPLNENFSDASTLTAIQKFYSGENIFITGATGFVGRLLLEKLLRSCPDIGNVYLLIRNKKGRSLYERIEELLDDVVFERLKEVDPKFRHKISPIEGDIALPELGINDQDRKLLTSEVSIVFHVAATVNFVEKLTLAIPTNVCGTKYVLKLCKEMTSLKAVVHVSTAYSNCYCDVMEEKFYPAPISPDNLIGLVDVLKDDLRENITASLLRGFPNTYVYTKAVAEQVVAEEGKGLPIGVFRPAIVSSSYKEPIKGWINNFNGPAGVVTGGYTGVMRTLHCDKDKYANVVPVDMTVNALIAIPWDVRNKYLDAKDGAFEAPVYNFESNSQNPITWSSYMSSVVKYGVKIPTIHCTCFYFFVLVKHPLVYFLSALLLHYLPAVLGDAIMICMAKKPRLVKFYRKIGKFCSVISYFCTRNFQFKSTRIREMIEAMSVEDRKLFFCDLKKLDWEEYLEGYVVGLRLYLLKDPLATLPKALLKWKRLYWCHQAAKVVVTLLFLRLVWFVISCSYKFVS